MKRLGAVCVLIGVNLVFYAFPVLPEPVPLLVKLATVDLGVLFAVVGVVLIARVRRA